MFYRLQVCPSEEAMELGFEHDDETDRDELCFVSHEQVRRNDLVQFYRMTKMQLIL